MARRRLGELNDDLPELGDLPDDDGDLDSSSDYCVTGDLELASRKTG
jgi:hypothetical protein